MAKRKSAVERLAELNASLDHSLGDADLVEKWDKALAELKAEHETLMAQVRADIKALRETSVAGRVRRATLANQGSPRLRIQA